MRPRATRAAWPSVRLAEGTLRRRSSADLDLWAFGLRIWIKKKIGGPGASGGGPDPSRRPAVLLLWRSVEVADKAGLGCLSHLDLVPPLDSVGPWATAGEKVAAAVLLRGGYGGQRRELVGWCVAMFPG